MTGYICTLVTSTAKLVTPAPVAPRHPPAEQAMPTEVGVYAKKQGQWVEVPPEIVYWKTGGVMKTIATAGIRHGDVNGHVPGANSHISLASPLELLIVEPEGIDLAEYQLHAQGGSERDVVDFDGKKIANRMYEVTFPVSAGSGQYGILPPSSTSGSFRMME